MDQNFEKYESLIEMIDSTPKVQPPERLTANIMRRLDVTEKASIWTRIKDDLQDLVRGTYKFAWTQKLTVSNPRECSYCFFMTGFFYFVMGIILMSGFRTISGSSSQTDWINLQPFLSLSTAIWLLALGGILILKNRTALKIARLGTLIYIFCTVSNGVLLSTYLHIQFAGIIMTGFIIGGIVMGAMLALAVETVEQVEFRRLA